MTGSQVVNGSEGPWSSLKICLGDEVWVHFQKHHDVVQMFVEIRSPFSFEKIKAHRKEIEVWHDRLQNLQGPLSDGGKDLLFFSFHMRNLHGESYQCLTDMLNVKIAEELVSWKDQQSREGAFVAQFRGQLRITVDFSGCLYGGAAVWMRAMGFTEEEIMICCEAALENIAHNKPAFLPGEPISRDHVISRLRAWRVRHQQWLAHVSKSDRPGTPQK
jgi:hypothetical protein